MAAKPLCSIPGCGKTVRTFGFCGTHYYRNRKYGDPLAESARTPPGAPLAFLMAALVSETDDCINWPFFKNQQGQGRLLIDGSQEYASRAVCQRAHGAPPTAKHEAAHLCGKGHDGCINPRHLRWATHAENEADKILHGTHNRGERHGRAKLSEADACEIRKRVKEGETLRAVANSYNVSQPTVSRLVNRINWSHMD